MSKNTVAESQQHTITLTKSQEYAFNQIKNFINDDAQRFFILKGYAGTGKTTLIRFLTQYLIEHKRHFQMLAPTGRAAKVIDDKVLDDRFDQNQTIQHATTIHSMIYTYSGFNRNVTDEELSTQDANGQLSLVFTPTQCDPQDKKTTIYIVDEASMISNMADNNDTQARFGEGKLLSELIDYDTRSGSKFIFIGDPCQLPPINDTDSPALNPSTFRPKAQTVQLTEIIRQSGDNDIVPLSKQIRKQIESLPDNKNTYGFRKVWGSLQFADSDSFVKHPSVDDMVHHYVQNMKSKGYNDSIYICNFNKVATAISLEARRQLLNTASTHPVKKDLLMVIQNNHPTGLVNGDLVEVVKCSRTIKQCAHLHFVEVVVREIGSGSERQALLMLDTLASGQLNLNSQQQTTLFIDFICRMKAKGIKQKAKAFDDHLRTDPYLNALRCTFGYAVTCHKAQGGEWNNVYLQLPRNITLNPIKQDYQWVYTAMTRAKDKIHIVNDFFIK